jgi:hypothetical protein
MMKKGCSHKKMHGKGGSEGLSGMKGKTWRRKMMRMERGITDKRGMRTLYTQ